MSYWAAPHPPTVDKSISGDSSYEKIPPVTITQMLITSWFFSSKSKHFSLTLRMASVLCSCLFLWFFSDICLQPDPSSGHQGQTSRSEVILFTVYTTVVSVNSSSSKCSSTSRLSLSPIKLCLWAPTDMKKMTNSHENPLKFIYNINFRRAYFYSLSPQMYS